MHSYNNSNENVSACLRVCAFLYFQRAKRSTRWIELDWNAGLQIRMYMANKRGTIERVTLTLHGLSTYTHATYLLFFLAHKLLYILAILFLFFLHLLPYHFRIFFSSFNILKICFRQNSIVCVACVLTEFLFPGIILLQPYN